VWPGILAEARDRHACLAAIAAKHGVGQRTILYRLEKERQSQSQRAGHESVSSDQHRSAPLSQQGPEEEVHVGEGLVDIGVPAVSGPAPPGQDPAAGDAVEKLLLRGQQRGVAWDALTTIAGCSRAVPSRFVDDLADDLSSVNNNDGAPFGGNGSARSARRRSEAACLRHLAGHGADGCSRAVSRADVTNMADAITPASSIEWLQVTLTATILSHSGFIPKITHSMAQAHDLHHLVVPDVFWKGTQPCAPCVLAV
jgi:hypothetical protein